MRCSPHTSARWTTVAVAAAWLSIATSSSAGDLRSSIEAGALYEVFFELTAEVRNRRFDADIEAGARLEMRAEPAADGAIALVLVRELRPGTKFYAIDPAGPFGDEVKMAAVTTLAEGSWEALAEARSAVDRLGDSAHERWAERTGSDREFDGSFAFVVIGPAEDRFRVELDADGRIAAVGNRLTDRWLTGPFGRFLDRWGREPDPVMGYWFWNRGESEPFSYEPHVYHALVQALEILRRPLPRAGGARTETDLLDEILDVVTTLTPKAEGRIHTELRPVELELLRAGVAATPRGSDPRIEVRRTPTSSTLEASWWTEDFRLTLRVGYGPRP